MRSHFGGATGLLWIKLARSVGSTHFVMPSPYVTLTSPFAPPLSGSSTPSRPRTLPSNHSSRLRENTFTGSSILKVPAASLACVGRGVASALLLKTQAAYQWYPSGSHQVSMKLIAFSRARSAASEGLRAKCSDGGPWVLPLT